MLQPSLSSFELITLDPLHFVGRQFGDYLFPKEFI